MEISTCHWAASHIHSLNHHCHSLPLFSYLKLGLFLLTPVSTFLEREGKVLLTEMLGKVPLFRDARGSVPWPRHILLLPLLLFCGHGALPQLHTSRARRGAPAITFQSTPVWKRWQNTLLHAAALKGFGE